MANQSDSAGPAGRPRFRVRLNTTPGMVLVSGATGSGKSTLIARLIEATLKDPEGNYNIVKAAAPVEFPMERARVRVRR